MLVIPARVKVVVVMVSALAVAVGLLTLALLAKPAQAQAQTITDTHKSTFSGFAGGCTEMVAIEGTSHTVAHTTIDATGGFHTKFQFHDIGRGVGLDSGDKYVFHSAFSDQANATGPFNETFTAIFKLIPQGSDKTADALIITGVFHVTVNANGEVTTEFLKFEDEPCT